MISGSTGATRDADVERFLKLFTLMPMDEIGRLAALGGAEINEAKKTLATEVTAVLHGRAAAETAAETARKTFEEARWPPTCPRSPFLPPSWRPASAFSASRVRAPPCRLEREAAVMFRAARCAQLYTDQRRARPDRQCEVTSDQVIKLSLGKKKHILVRPS